VNKINISDNRGAISAFIIKSQNGILCLCSVQGKKNNRFAYNRK
jgi:hypothetical protein